MVHENISRQWLSQMPTIKCLNVHSKSIADKNFFPQKKIKVEDGSEVAVKEEKVEEGTETTETEPETPKKKKKKRGRGMNAV